MQVVFSAGNHKSSLAVWTSGLSCSQPFWCPYDQRWSQLA